MPPIQPTEEAEVVQTFQLVLHSTERQSSAATNIQFMLAVSGNMRRNAALINSGKPGQWHILFGQLRDKCRRCGWTATRVKQMPSEMAQCGPFHMAGALLDIPGTNGYIHRAL